MKAIDSFNGLNNVTDPMRLGASWLTLADNVDVTDSGGLVRRNGYELERSGSFASAYSTIDHSRMYLATASGIQTHDGVAVCDLTSPATVYWAEVNHRVYFNNGTDSGIIEPDHAVTQWRGAPVSYGAGFKGDDGQDLGVLFETLPLGTDVIQFWRGRMYAAQYLPSDDQTVIWFSEPLGYHLFNLASNFIIVPGRVHMLAPHAEALIVGTNTTIHAYTGDSIAQVADYGVVPGQHWASDNGRILFWSLRGLCAALPFQNLTENQISVSPGVWAGGCIVKQGGQRRYLALLQRGGMPYNAH